MRVTQSMLSNNFLRNITTSYSKMGDIQDQIQTGKKVNRPSDDPVVVMKGIGYRTEVAKVEQFQRNIGEVNSWLDITDNTLDKVGQALQRINELTIKAANDTNTSDERAKINEELEQIREHLQDLANTKVGTKYIFSGTKTTTPIYDTTAGSYVAADPAFQKDVNIEIFDGITLKSNTNVYDLFVSMDKLIGDMTSGTVEHRASIGDIETKINDLLVVRANVGARQNRVELMDDRLSSQEIISVTRMSENEDIDYERTITDMISQESVHKAALSVGAKIIQPSLADFLR